MTVHFWFLLPTQIRILTERCPPQVNPAEESGIFRISQSSLHILLM